MKKIRFVAIMILIIFCVLACGKEEIQGVSVTESGQIAVTFVVPEGMTVEDVLKSKIGSENTMHFSYMDSSNREGFFYWYEVENGGILSRFDHVYRYAPQASPSSATGVSAPPAWATINSIPSDGEIFKVEDTQLLKEKYGVDLYFD